LLTAVAAGSVGLAVLLALLYLIYGLFVLYVVVQLILRLALIDLLLALAPITWGLWILPHTAGWARHWLRTFMTTVFQQAVQLIALALAFGFLQEFAGIATFEPVQDLIWKLLLSLAFVYLATRVPSLLGQAGTFDAWLRTLHYGMSLPGSLARSARAVGMLAGGAAGGPAGMAAGELPHVPNHRRSCRMPRPDRRGRLSRGAALPAHAGVKPALLRPYGPHGPLL